MSIRDAERIMVAREALEDIANGKDGICGCCGAGEQKHRRGCQAAAALTILDLTPLNITLREKRE
jgi:hypothetical protein